MKPQNSNNSKSVAIMSDSQRVRNALTKSNAYNSVTPKINSSGLTNAKNNASKKRSNTNDQTANGNMIHNVASLAYKFQTRLKYPQNSDRDLIMGNATPVDVEREGDEGDESFILRNSSMRNAYLKKITLLSR